MAGDGMNVIVMPGPAWINGYCYENTSDLILVIEPADGVLNRIDRIAIRLDTVERKITVVIKKGTFASSPVATSLQRDADAYELGIADVSIAKGTISISQANISDLRLNSTLCGVVNSLIQVDTTTLLNQYEVGMQQKEDDFTQQFIEWFQGIKGTLSGDVAGNLLNLINTHKNDTNNPHNVTASQVGAETPTGAQAKADNVQANLNSHLNDNVKHITPTERTIWTVKLGIHSGGFSGVDGDLVVSSNTVFPKTHMCYNNLTINSGVKFYAAPTAHQSLPITPNSEPYVIFIKGILTLNGNIEVVGCAGGGSDNGSHICDSGSGGGVLYVFANKIVGTGKILANGEDATPITALSWGGGGGGGLGYYNGKTMSPGTANYNSINPPTGGTSGFGGNLNMFKFGGYNLLALNDTGGGAGGTGVADDSTTSGSGWYFHGGGGGAGLAGNGGNGGAVSAYCPQSTYTGVGGAGGGGGGLVYLFCMNPLPAITVQAKGGNGSSAFAGSGSFQIGAGGGGGGGMVVVISANAGSVSANAAGGSAGNSLNGAGTASAGGAGVVALLSLT
jgi:hypothetical protein